jgi:hypothetical protein
MFFNKKNSGLLSDKNIKAEKNIQPVMSTG